MTIIPLGQEHAAETAEISRQAILHQGARSYSSAQLQAWADRFTPELMAGRLEGVLPIGAVVDGRLAGYGCLNLQVSELDYLYVSPEMAGQGVGGALAKEIIRMAREAGLKRLWLSASLNALSFYSRLGWVEVERIDRCLGVESLVSVRMVLDLES